MLPFSMDITIPQFLGTTATLANLGVLVWVMKKYVGRVDKHEEILIKLAETMKTVVEATQKDREYIDDLYTKTHRNSEEIVGIITVHEVKGCVEPRRVKIGGVK